MPNKPHVSTPESGSRAVGTDPQESRTHRRAWQAADWLDKKLISVIGPPPLGPYGADTSENPRDAACPLCGSVMKQHVVEHEGGHVFLHCPTPNGGQIAEI